MGLLTSLFFRAATPENPSFGINSAEAWETFLSGEPSASGVSVTTEKALTYSPWWRGINLIANTVARLPTITYKRTAGDNGKERATDHPAYRLLRKKPNPFQTAFVLKRQLIGHAASAGNGYAFIDFTGGAIPIALWPLDPSQVTPRRLDGRKVFDVESEGRTSTLENWEVLHVIGYTVDGLTGVSVVEKARDSLGLGIGLRTYGAKYFKNAARPATVLETPTKLNPEAAKELQASWERMHGGLDNAHRTAILHSGLTAKILSFNAKDSQFIEERQFELLEIANWLGIPPHKLGDKSTRGYASLEEENRAFLDDCIDAWLVCVEEESEDKLFTEQEKADDSHLVEFSRRELARGDITARTNHWRMATGGRPWASPNEAREDFGLNPSEDEGADEIMVPLNMGKGGQDNEPDDKGGPRPGNPQDNEALLKAHREILADAVGRMVRRIGAQAEKAAKDCQAFETWVDGIETEFLHPTILALANVDRVCELIRGDDRQGSAVSWLLPEVKAAYAALLDTATAKTLQGEVAKLNAVLSEAMPPKAVTLFLGDECNLIGERGPVVNVNITNTPASVTTNVAAAPVPQVKVDAPITVHVPKQQTVIQAGRVESIKRENGKTTIEEKQ